MLIDIDAFIGQVDPGSHLPDWETLPQEMATFFQAAIDWGIEAGLRFLAYLGGIALIVKIFQSK